MFSCVLHTQRVIRCSDVTLQSETLDPLLAACAESPARGNGRRPPASPLHPDACAEMRRQILYLQVLVTLIDSFPFYFDDLDDTAIPVPLIHLKELRQCVTACIGFADSI